jgi:hypothetical protein
MKPKSLFLTALGAAAVLAPALAPRSLHGQAGADDALYTPVIAEVAKQQALIRENQTKIDDTLALIAEDLRIARIYAGRGGGKSK